jgi:hypothetical protein
MTSCDEIEAVLGSHRECAATPQGTRVSTQCLYPSFEPVKVYVVKIGEGYKVHDGAGAVISAWDHAREGAVINRALAKHAARYKLDLVENHLQCSVPSINWISAAIVAVANASAAAAYSAIEHAVAAAENLLKEKIFAELLEVSPEKNIAKNYEMPGASGRQYIFDYGVQFPEDRLLLIDAVSPHHVSINSKYTAFSDASLIQGGVNLRKFAVYDKPLSHDDVALLSQVADIVPLLSLQRGIRADFHVG